MDEHGYLADGWIYDSYYEGWFYTDVNAGMLSGWQFLDHAWYYLNPISDGTKGKMYANCMTPDGYFVGADGRWIP